MSVRWQPRDGGENAIYPVCVANVFRRTFNVQGIWRGGVVVMCRGGLFYAKCHCRPGKWVDATMANYQSRGGLYILEDPVVQCTAFFHSHAGQSITITSLIRPFSNFPRTTHPTSCLITAAKIPMQHRQIQPRMYCRTISVLMSSQGKHKYYAPSPM